MRRRQRRAPLPGAGAAARARRSTPATLLLEPVGPQHRAGDDAGRAAGRAQAARDPVLVVTPGRPDGDRRRRLHAPRCAARARSPPTGAIVHPRHHARPARDRLRLHPRRAGRRRRGRGVARFVEKPDLRHGRSATWPKAATTGTAASSCCARRSGWTRSSASAPTSPTATRAAWAARSDRRQLRAPGQATQFAAVPARVGRLRGDGAAAPAAAFDIRMVPLDAGWNDLGAWDAVWQVGEKDAAGNASVGDALAAATARNTLVHATSRLVGVVGLDDVVVVETADAVLVADRSRSQDVKKIVDRARRAASAASTRCTARCTGPGAGTTASTPAPRFQVKRIMVKPGASLSLQMHHHRAEHWIVVSRHGRGDQRRQGDPADREPEHLHPARRDASPRQPAARCRSRSSRCSRAATSARTTSCASRTPTGETELAGHSCNDCASSP